ncbi:hypothetical protein D3C86_1495290 [compost metagenome]
MATVGECLLVGQLQHLRIRRFSQARLAEAQRCAPQARHTFDIASALLIENINAFATLDQQWAQLFVQPQIGLRVKVVGDISLGQGRITSGHDVILFNHQSVVCVCGT